MTEGKSVPASGGSHQLIDKGDSVPASINALRADSSPINVQEKRGKSGQADVSQNGGAIGTRKRGQRERGAFGRGERPRRAALSIQSDASHSGAPQIPNAQAKHGWRVALLFLE